MQRHILVLTLHKPDDFQFESWLGTGTGDAKVSLIFDAENASAELLARLRGSKLYRFVEAYPNYLNNGRVYADLEDLHRQSPVTHVVALGEDDIIRAARLRERWQLEGQGIANALGFRDKTAMRKAVADAGIRVHAGRPLENPLDLLDFVAAHRLPVYVKPRTSSGSVFGRRIGTNEELAEFLETGFCPRIPYSEYASDLCVEVFQPGDLFHVDGIAVGDDFLWAWPSKYLTRGLQIGTLGDGVVVGSYMLSRSNVLFEPLVGYVTRVCAALELPGGHGFHAEVFVNDDGGLSLCEIACRTGGGKINELLSAAGGPDLNKLQFLLQSQTITRREGERLARESVPKELCGWFLIPPQPGTCRKVPKFSDLPWIKSSKINMAPGQKGWHRSFSGDSMGYAIVAGAGEEEVRRNLERTIAHLFENMIFEQAEDQVT